MPSLFVIQGRDQGKRFELQTHVMGVGRDVSNRIRLHDTEVSRRHAEIRQAADGYHWVDLGSSNGSYVNHARVQQQALRSGDRVQVGRTLMIYTDAADTRAPSPQGDVDIAVKDSFSDLALEHGIGEKSVVVRKIQDEVR